jgi:Phosphotransferase enzyme family
MNLDDKTARAVQDALARMGLVANGELPPLAGLTGGVSSLIVRADTLRGPVCVKQALPKLRVAADWNAPIERNRAEVAWMKIAAEVAPGSVPDILGEDESSYAFAMAFLDPATYPVWKDLLMVGDVDPAVAGAIAKLLLAVHGDTAGDDIVARTFATDESFQALRLQPYFGATALRHPGCAAALERLIHVTTHEKRALVHGDVSPKNILVGPNGPVLLDAECAWYGDPAFDLAFCLNHLLLKCLARPSSMPAFLCCFDALAQTYLAGVTWEPAAALEMRAAALLPALLLARIDGKSPVEYLTLDSDKDRVRRFSIPLVIQPPTRLANIRTAWQKESAS